MQRLTITVFSMVVALLALVPASALDGNGSTVLVGAAVAALLLAGLALRDGRGRVDVHRLRVTTGPARDERRLHGSFRCQSNPDAPGRPRPRAPGRHARPA